MTETQDLESLNIKRESLKGKLSDIESFLKFSRFKIKSVNELNFKSKEADDVFKEFEDVQNQIECFLTEENESQIISNASEIQILYYSIKSTIQQILDHVKNPIKINPECKSKSEIVPSPLSEKSSNTQRLLNPETLNNSTPEISKLSNVKSSLFRDNSIIELNSFHAESFAYHPPQRSSRVKPKLPPCQLPKFSGKINDWIGFRDTFESLIHNDPEIVAIDKFSYLLSCLDESAKEEIMGIRLSSENYPIAWNILQTRFDNNQILIQNHLNELFTCKPASNESAVELRRVLNCYKANVTQLINLCKDAEGCDVFIIHMIKQRIDSSTLRAMEISEISSTSWIEAKSFLENRCRFLDRLSNEKIVINQKVPVSSNSCPNPTQVVMFNKNLSKIQCNVCQADHYTFLCPEIRNVPLINRIQKLKSLRLCFNCLHPNHKSCNCRNKKKCRECNGNHHTLIHKYFVPNTKSNQSEKIKIVPNSDGKVSLSKHPTRSSNNDCLSPKGKFKHVFHSTAKIFVEDAHKIQQPCRVLLDNGSQSSFITESFARRLKLPRKDVLLRINGLNLEPISVRHSVQIKVKSRINNYTKSIDCLVVPSITEDIPDRKIESPAFNFPNKQLADSEFNVPSKIDILIGAEHFIELLQDGKMKINHTQITLKNSVFGWFVTGSIESTPKSNEIKCFMNVQEPPISPSIH